MLRDSQIPSMEQFYRGIIYFCPARAQGTLPDLGKTFVFINITRICATLQWKVQFEYLNTTVNVSWYCPISNMQRPGFASKFAYTVWVVKPNKIQKFFSTLQKQILKEFLPDDLRSSLSKPYLWPFCMALKYWRQISLTFSEERSANPNTMLSIDGLFVSTISE